MSLHVHKQMVSLILCEAIHEPSSGRLWELVRGQQTRKRLAHEERDTPPLRSCKVASALPPIAFQLHPSPPHRASSHQTPPVAGHCKVPAKPAQPSLSQHGSSVATHQVWLACRQASGSWHMVSGRGQACMRAHAVLRSPVHACIHVKRSTMRVFVVA